jgi:hypothetical protein
MNLARALHPLCRPAHLTLGRAVILCLNFVGLMANCWLAPALLRAGEPDFERQIAPLLIRSCLGCHNASDSAGGLDLTERDRALAGGESGQAAIVPGKVDESYLVDRLRDGEMPPEGKGQPLSAELRGTLSAWIATGAHWPDGRRLSRFELTTPERAGRDWWSLEPPKRAPVPDVQHVDRVRTPVDAFVWARLEERGLAPAPEADRATLIRRATFDLWGLPPDPDEVDAFVADRAADAYEQLIDRLLAAPQYGERWGQHWLDVVRFGESNGYETNGLRPNAWPYRDYVIDAFNRDLPYPQFILEQLAGDQLQADAATGFLVAGAHDVVGSPDVELTRQQRSNDLDDFVSTTSQTFLGLTIGCARCHDHKFDPLSQRDYYAWQALFSGVFHGERDVAPSLDADQQRERSQWNEQLARLELDIRRTAARAEPLARPSGRPAADDPRAGEPTVLRPAVHALGNIDRFAPAPARFVRFTILAAHQGEPCIDELEVLAADDGRNAALASAGATATASSVLEGGKLPIHQTAHLIDGKYGNSFSWIGSQTAGDWVQIELPQTVTIDRVEWARDRQGVFADRVAVGYRIEIAERPGEWQTVATADDRRTFTPAQPPSQPVAAEGALGDELARLRSQAEVLRGRLGRRDARRIYAGTFAGPQPIHRLQRGEVMQPREEVSPGTPSMIGSPAEIAPDASEAQRRLALARWLGDPSNPLVSRVMVNRIWQYHFGRGLVRTPSDFGFGGGQPSHAELLDWLALEFIDHGWRTKPLQRLIMLSSVYRQASRLDNAAAALDGGNELLWRYQPRRLEAEPIHDAILSVAGTLALQGGGPGYDVFLPNASNVKVYEPKPELGPAEWRRMIYQTKPRMRAEPTFGVFDCPDASGSMARRNVSTTALQSLNLLNSPFVVQQSSKFAQRLEREHPRDVDAQIRRAFRLAFARPPASDELAAAGKLVAAQGLAQLCRVLLNANEFVYIR